MTTRRNEDRWSEMLHSSTIGVDQGLPVVEIIFPDERGHLYQNSIIDFCDEVDRHNTGLFSILFYVEEKGGVVDRRGYLPSAKNYKKGWIDLSAIDVWEIIEYFYQAWTPGSRRPKVSFSWKARRPEFMEILENESGIDDRR